MASKSSLRLFAIAATICAIVFLAIGIVFIVLFANAQSTATKLSTTTPSPGTTTSTAQPTNANNGPLTRLPANVYPTFYTLSFKTYLNSTMAQGITTSNIYTFAGTVAIQLSCTRPTNNITMHAVGLQIHAPQLQLLGANGKTIAVTSLTFNAQTQMAKFALAATICTTTNQKYLLTMGYSSPLGNNVLQGYYRTSYMEKGVSQVLAVTQFEALGARLAFPCFDAPAFKAVFAVTMVYPAEYTALSNGMEQSTSIANGWKTTQFQNTQKMSTYLLAFTVGKYKHVTIQSNTVKKTTFRLWARPSLIENNQTAFAAMAGPKVLAAYEKYFGIPFPLVKQGLRLGISITLYESVKNDWALDLLAVPEFAAGAMENWGLVIFRETGLLYQPSIYPSWKKQQVAQFIAHELAHMWFGDLVTMRWWNDLWLNEAFAQFLSWKGTDIIANYKWDIMHQFVHEMQLAMLVDQMPQSHPVLNSGSLAITYRKGAAVLQMINQTLGIDPSTNRTRMQLGLTNYLRKYNHSNVVHQQLYDAWQQIINAANLHGWNANTILNVTDFSSTWVNNAGFPVLNVQWTPVNNMISVNQKPFIVSSSQSSPKQFTYRIPVWYQTQPGKQRMFWVANSSVQITDQSSFGTQNSFVLLNPQANGYYRVNYDKYTWSGLSHALQTNAKQFDLRARSQLIDDALNLARAGQLSYTVPFSLMQYLQQEGSWIPWQTAMVNLQYIGIMLARTANYSTYATYVNSIIYQPYMKLNFTQINNMSPNNVIPEDFMLLIAGTACRVGMPACVNNFAGQFQQTMQKCQGSRLSSNCNNIPANQREVAYCQGVRQKGAIAFNFLYQQYLTESDNQERVNIINGMVCANKVWLVQKLLDGCLRYDIIQPQVRFAYRKLAFNPIAVSIMATHLVRNWNNVNPIKRHAARDIELIRAAIRNLNSMPALQQMTAFAANNAANGNTRSISKQLQYVQANIQWMNSTAQQAINAMRQYTMPSGG